MASAADMLVDVVERRDRADDPRLRELRAVLDRRRRQSLARQLGTTRWASPPPGMSVRAAIILWLLTSAALALLLFALGYFR